MLNSFAEVPRTKKIPVRAEDSCFGTPTFRGKVSFAEEEQLATCFPGACTVGSSPAPTPMGSNKKGKGKGKKSGKNQTQAQLQQCELLVSGVSEVQPDDEGQQSEEAIHQKRRCLLQVSNSLVHRKPTRRLRLCRVSSLSTPSTLTGTPEPPSTQDSPATTQSGISSKVTPLGFVFHILLVSADSGLQGGDRGSVAGSWQRVRRIPQVRSDSPQFLRGLTTCS